MRAISKCLITAAFASLPAAALAENTCANRDTVVERLAMGYGETFQGGGIQSEERIFEVWYSEEDGTWTILLTKADGTSCVMASGTDWRTPLPSDKLKVGIPG